MAGDTVYDAILGSLSLKQVSESSLTRSAQPVEGMSSGSPDVSEYFGGTSQPKATFTSGDIGGILSIANVCTAGIAVASGSIVLPFRKESNLGTHASGSSHTTLSGTNGLIIPTSFQASRDGNASAALECSFISTNGVADPVAVNQNQALAAQAFNALYDLGPVLFNGVTIAEVQSATIDTGIQVEARKYGSAGNIFDTQVTIKARRPSIKITFNNFAALVSFASSFTVGTAAIVYFRKRSGASYVSNATAQHCKFSFADGIISSDDTGASGTDPGEASLTFYGETLVASGAAAIV